MVYTYPRARTCTTHANIHRRAFVSVHTHLDTQRGSTGNYFLKCYKTVPERDGYFDDHFVQRITSILTVCSHLFHSVPFQFNP